jgi:putative membrane protein
MQWSMAGGGVVYMILGAAAVFLYALRTLGLGRTLGFMLPAVLISLTSELLGTSTGFPFGHYSYLSGLGYKIAGLVPFTIPLSWFYVGCSAYLLGRAGLAVDKKPTLLRHLGAIVLGALLLTSWDFVLDPAMSQTALPFWYWQQPGAFFGMPYQNFAGWMGTGSVFMTVAALLWRNKPIQLERSQLNVPLIIYLSNFGFATVMSVAAGFSIPILLGLVLGVAPAVVLWWKATVSPSPISIEPATNEVAVASVKVALK